MNEAKLYAQIKEAIGDSYFLQRVENSIDVGTPDVYFARRHQYSKLQGWMELKVIDKLPVRKTTKIKIAFRPGQFAWYKRASEANINYFLLIWTPEYYYVFPPKFIMQEYTHNEFDEGIKFNTLKDSYLNRGLSYNGLEDFLSGFCYDAE